MKFSCWISKGKTWFIGISTRATTYPHRRRVAGRQTWGQTHARRRSRDKRDRRRLLAAESLTGKRRWRRRVSGGGGYILRTTGTVFKIKNPRSRNRAARSTLSLVSSLFFDIFFHFFFFMGFYVLYDPTAWPKTHPDEITITTVLRFVWTRVKTTDPNCIFPRLKDDNKSIII